MALVDNEVLALADGEHVLHEIAEDARQVVVRPDLFLRAPQERQDPLLVLLLLRGRQLGAEHVHVRDEAHGHAFRKRAEPDRIAGACHERKETPAEIHERIQIVGDVPFGHVEVAVNGDPIDDADAGTVFVEEERILLALLGPQHLFDRVVERAHPRLDRRTPLEVPDRVVLQEWRSGPRADERGRPDVSAAAGGKRIVVLDAGDGMPHLDRPDRGKLLVGL